MKIFKSKHKLKKEILNIKNISFVPTMGGIHNGHVSLIKTSQKNSPKIFVKNLILVKIYYVVCQYYILLRTAIFGHRIY